MSEIYLDNGATTRVDERVAAAAAEAMLVTYGNPSSAHRLGVAAARRVADARAQVARALGADASEIFFTSGGTEANALALLGVARPGHLVTSGFEHPSVAETAAALGEKNVAVDCVAPRRDGCVTVEDMVAAVRPETSLVACILVQNEIGTVQPAAAIARAVKAKAPRCHVHVDAVQAFGKLALDVAAAPFDSLSISAHKIHGPKGIGALWLRRGTKLRPLVHGGGQERGLRPGSENVPGIVALGLAAELAEAARAEAGPRMAAQRDRLWASLSAALPQLWRNGAPAQAAPHILSVGFPGVPAEPLLHLVEDAGVYVSAGSACHAKNKTPSPTLRALGVPDDVGVLRFSFSRFTTDAEIARAAEVVIASVKALS